MGPLRGLVFWALIVLGACATPKKLIKDRMSQEHCKQKIAGMKSNAQSGPSIDVNPTCDIGKVSYMYSRGQLQLSFWRDSPFQICLVELKRFEIVRSTDNNNQQLEQIPDGENVCFQNRNANGGTVYIVLKPRGFTYISEIYYEIQRLHLTDDSSVNPNPRGQLSVSTSPSPPTPRTHHPQFDIITPVPNVHDLRMRRPESLRRPVQTPLPLSRQWFLRQLPLNRNRAAENTWRPTLNTIPVENVRTPAENTWRSVENTRRQAENTWRPAENSWRQAENTWRPAENSWRQAENTWRPAVNSLRPAENTWRPAENSLRQAENTWRQAENTWSPSSWQRENMRFLRQQRPQTNFRQLRNSNFVI
nr:uncharacterized protein LOC105325933 [Crassostrea gigas]